MSFTAEVTGSSPAAPATVFWAFFKFSLLSDKFRKAQALSDGAQFTGKLGVGLAILAPVLVLLSYAIRPSPTDLEFWPGAVMRMLIATITISLVTNSGTAAWFVGGGAGGLRYLSDDPLSFAAKVTLTLIPGSVVTIDTP